MQLGIFSGGLSSFFSNDAEEGADDSATAGMELAVLGTYVRPFVFFSNQGELMGHVWSGTASEKTSAYQVGPNLIFYSSHCFYLNNYFKRLGFGYVTRSSRIFKIRLRIYS